MKMRKLLASGVAASVAVTSMATVASAAEKTWDMGTSVATVNSSVSIKGDINPALGQSADQAEMQWVKITVGGKIHAYKDKNGRYKIVTEQHQHNGWNDKDFHTFTTTGANVYYQDKDKWDEASSEYVGTEIIGNDWYSAPTIVVKGYKYDEDGKKIAVTKDYTMTTDWNFDTNSGTTWKIAVLKDTESVYRPGEFAPNFFDIIESIDLSVSNIVSDGTGNCSIEDKDVYLALKALGDKYVTEIGDAMVYDAAEKLVQTYDRSYSSIEKKLAAEEDNKAAALLAYAITNGGYKVSTSTWLEGSSKTTLSLGIKYPFIAEKWTDVDGARVVMRTDVQKLSVTGDHLSQGATGNDSNQSYKDEDTTAGTDPKDFAGLASQFAEFFNKQTNGTVTFKFTTPTAAGSSNDWVVGGVPSTETGIKNALNGASANDFALFVNYQTTGSLQALTSIDAAAGTVTFDVSDILDSMGGQTIGVVEDIYFGLATGIKYDDDHKGLYVESITFAYDEDSAEDIVEEEEEEEAEEEEAEEEEEEVEEEEAEEEEEEAELEEEEEEAEEEEAEEEDDDDVQGDVVTTPSEDDDSNPATGVALAVVPALVAAAAAVVSKKRK